MNEFRGMPLQIPVGHVELAGRLLTTHRAAALVIIASLYESDCDYGYHCLARDLGEAGFDVLTFDLLTADEQMIDLRTARFRSDVPLLGERLRDVALWINAKPEIRDLPVIVFATAAAAAGALFSAAVYPYLFSGLILLRARTDLAGPAISFVRVPTLLLAGDDQPSLAMLNREAVARFAGEARLEVLHFSSPDDEFESVAGVAADWMLDAVPLLAVAT